MLTEEKKSIFFPKIKPQNQSQTTEIQLFTIKN